MQAKLIIRDEVNVKIEGLALPERKDLSKKYKFDIPGARHIPAVRLGRWDGKKAFFQLGGSTYVNLLPEILPWLVERGYDIDLDDQRDYNTTFEFEEVDEETYSHVLWPPGHERAGQPIVLRDYQIEIINRFLGNTQCLQEVATGAGKTLITAALSKSVESHGRSIVIVPNKSLVTQTEKDYRNLGLDVGVYFGDRKELGRTHTICTWQSLNSLEKKGKDDSAALARFYELVLRDVVAVIVDEVHMAKADVLMGMLSGPMSRIPLRWGLTGTIPKEDFEKYSLTCSIGAVAGHLSASELQSQGVLANCHVNIVQIVDSVEYTNYQSELKYLLETTGRLDYMAQLVEKMREGGNTLVLVDRVAAGKALEERIKDAVFVSGATKGDKRQDEYDEISTSSNKVIIATYGVAAVGINIPRIFNLVLVEPGKSFVRVIQSIGRGIRKAEDKDFVQIWDLTSTCKFARRHLTKRKQFYKDANYPFAVEKGHWQ